ncbi:hypothetical protein [Paraburkholderia aromaticivorans]|uniref:hypothetical protein n=1 Tax=Paraburkholderia aromaticivorans TaxID=2026199 RepID=UPI003D66AF48
MVLHHDHKENKNNIVDGQQRTITLLLIVHALIKRRLPALQNKHLRAQLENLRSGMFQPSFSSDTSQQNIWTNYCEIERAVSRPEFAEAHVDFVLNRCEKTLRRIGKPRRPTPRRSFPTDLGDSRHSISPLHSAGRGLRPIPNRFKEYCPTPWQAWRPRLRRHAVCPGQIIRRGRS